MDGFGVTPTVGPKKPSTWKVGGATVVSFVALLYVIEAWDSLHGQNLNDDGILPRQEDGLTGIIWAPLLHANWEHLYSNTGPALVLGFLVTLTGIWRFLGATAIVWILGGFGTWVIGSSGSTIGASGVIFGWLTFLIVFGFFTRRAWQIVIGLLVLLYYGTVFLGILPGTPGVSWQGHLCGAIAGVMAAYLLSGPERDARQRGKTGNSQLRF